MKIEMNEFVFYTEVHGEMVLANIETGKYASIGGSGQQIWESLVKGQEVEDIIDALVERFQVEKHATSKDVHEFLNHLEAMKFIQRVEKKK